MMSNRVFSEFIRFAVVGVISTLFNYSIFFVLLHYIHLNYLLASAVGFIAGIYISYSLNRAVTFKSINHNKKKEAFMYIAVCLVSLAVSLSCLKIIVGVFGIDPLLGNIISIGISTICNFTGAKFVVFRVRS